MQEMLPASREAPAWIESALSVLQPQGTSRAGHHERASLHMA